MPKDLKNNPFTRFFPSIEEAERYAEQVAPQLLETLGNREGVKLEQIVEWLQSDGDLTIETFDRLFGSKDGESSKEEPNQGSMDTGNEADESPRINEAVESIFGITLNSNSKKNLVYLSDLANSYTQTHIDLTLLEQALFERLLLEDPNQSLVGHIKNDSSILQTDVIIYLYDCYLRLSQSSAVDEHDRTEIRKLIVRNVATALKQPQLYESQDLNYQFYSLFNSNEDVDEKYLKEFINKLVVEIIIDEENHLDIIHSTFQPILEHVHIKIAQSNLLSFPKATIFSFLITICSNKLLAEVFIDYNTPKQQKPGNVYSNTSLGAILCLSCLPKTNEGLYEFYDKPLNISIHSTGNIDLNIWNNLDSIYVNLHQVFLSLLKVSPVVRHKTLSWLGNCLQANAERGKFWNSHGMNLLGDMGGSNVSDGFILNLGAVLLKLCEPFIYKDDLKYLKIDPTYTAVKVNSDEDRRVRGIHIHDLASETCFIPTEEGEQLAVSDQFNFITECFFLAQKSLDIGFRVCAEKMLRIYQDLARVQRAFLDAQEAGGASHEITEAMKERMETEMTRYLSLKTALIEPKTLELLVRLHITTSKWLVQVLLNTNIIPYNPTVDVPLTFPLPDFSPSSLKYVPEFLLENLTGFVLFLKRFNTKCFEDYGSSFLEPTLTLIIVFMGSSKYLRNPHLRAGLAECLESLLPKDEDKVNPLNPKPIGDYCRRQLFQQHPLRVHIIPSLLDVFVGIEMTGQNVQFEQKFNYRRPMYILMDYLWQLKEHRNCFKQLAALAEGNMEAVTPPLFLRFLNLLINDAVFLLDEALSNIAQLKSLQQARDSGLWRELPAREREQNETLFQHTGMIAKFDNILGRWTIHTLEYLTSEIQTIFCHSTMVDRVAAMLNYFLHNLVGPNQKNFKVKDQDEYDFNPALLVTNICKIYIHLEGSDSFCLAVSKDGRSYNSSLFQQAEYVLARIGRGDLITDLQAVAKKVSKLASQQETEEEILADAPEEFLDPIMSTLMSDPVILPSSKAIVDRTTIARHLLSDQTDPFNRAPLTMEMVKSDTELKQKIQLWIEERKLNYKK